MANKRQQIMTALETLLNTTSGLENKVYLWRQEPFAESELPAATFGDLDATAEPLAAGYTQHTMELQLQIITSGEDCAESVRTLAENLLTVLATDPTVGGLADFIDFTGLDMSGELANKEIAAGQIGLTVTYQTENYAF